jgi:phage terminase small subunit
MTESRRLKPPRGLLPTTRRWFDEVVERWELEPHHVRLLALACQSWDESQRAAAIVLAEGLIVTMPSGAKRPNPACRVAHEARALFARLLRELDLDVTVPAESLRPPVLRSVAGRRRA